MDDIMKYLPLLLIPLVLLQFGMQIGAIVSLVRRKKVRFDNKAIWALIILIGGLIGAVIYFVAKGDEE